jgi:hypothetical protein
MTFLTARRLDVQAVAPGCRQLTIRSELIALAKTVAATHGNQFRTLPALLEGRQPTIEDWKKTYEAASPGSLFRLTFDSDDASKYELKSLYQSEGTDAGSGPWRLVI